MKTDVHSVIIFTDGSSRGNPGPGGFGAIVITPKNVEVGSKNYEVKEVGGRENHTTNNRMELQAALSALSVIQNSEFIIRIYTDSTYLINGITKWVFGWRKNNWMTSQRKPVENRDLWEMLLLATQGQTIDWNYVGGHIGVAGNTRCDEIATSFADGAIPKLYSGSLKEYGISHILDIRHDDGMAKEKHSIRAHSNAKAYSYVSLVDGVIQTHQTWGECESRVKGKKAKYKKVLSAGEEQALIAEWNKNR